MVESSLMAVNSELKRRQVSSIILSISITVSILIDWPRTKNETGQPNNGRGGGRGAGGICFFVSKAAASLEQDIFSLRLRCYGSVRFFFFFVVKLLFWCSSRAKKAFGLK